jgi:hypothetical protein
MVYGRIQKKQLGLNRAFEDNKFRCLRVLALLTKDPLLQPQSEHNIEPAEHVLKFVLMLLAYELPLQIARAISVSAPPAACTLGLPGCAVAVPQDLASVEYLSQNRVWFLTRPSASHVTSWKVVGKGLLFNVVDLKEEPDYVILRKDQHIVG